MLTQKKLFHFHVINIYINDWKQAPVWTPKKIGLKTKKWFQLDKIHIDPAKGNDFHNQKVKISDSNIFFKGDEKEEMLPKIFIFIPKTTYIKQHFNI